MAAFVFQTCSESNLKLDLEKHEDVQLALQAKIAEELQAVQAYCGTLRASAVMQGAAVSENVQASTQSQIEEAIHPWPTILEQPTPEVADGRFAKAFPLHFPMGVADPRQPRLRSDYSFIDAVQHLFSYRTGHFLKATDGHRVVWALFNTALREIAREKGNLVHKMAGETILTKAELRRMCDSRDDLVQRIGSFGVDIPTTSMHWKRQSNNLEWIVWQMSWSPPWTPVKK